MIKAISKICNRSLWALFLLTQPLVAGETSLISSAEWAEIVKRPQREDLIVLVDGNKISGTVEKLPPIDFSFGTLSFSVDEVASASLTEKNQQLFVQYTTWEGQSYFGPIAKAPFLL